MKKALLVASVQSHIAQFHRPLIALLKEAGYEIHVAARNNLEEKNGLKLQNVDQIFDIPFERFPLDKKNLQAYGQMKALIDREGYDLISCNTPAAGVVTRLAARDARKKGTRVIYTAHGFHFYKGAPKKNWLIYYPIEKQMAHFTDTLITISKEDYALARKNFHTEVRHIFGVGADKEKYTSVSGQAVEEFRRKNYDGRFLITCTGELNANKNQITLIRAMKTVAEAYPEALALLAGNGPEEDRLREEIRKLGLEKNVELLGYRTDLEWYVNASDLIVSLSIREGLGLNIVEAMMCAKPVLVSSNRGHRELVRNGESGIIVKDARDPASVAQAVIKMISDKDLRERCGLRAKADSRKYTMDAVKKQLNKIYLQN